MIIFLYSSENICIYFSRHRLVDAKSKCFNVKLDISTRWPADANDIKALFLGYNEVLSALIEMSEDSNQNPATNNKAKYIHKKT